MTQAKFIWGSRRRFLKQLGAASLMPAAINTGLSASGLLWARGALAAGAAPKRLLTIHVTNGAVPGTWHAIGEGTNYTLPEASSPFNPYKNKCLFFQNITGAGGHGPFYQCMAGEKRDSIDVYLGRKIGTSTPFSSIQLGVNSSGGLSRLNGNDIPFEMSPLKAFNRLFPSSSGSGDLRTLQKKGIIGANTAMINELSSKLGSVQKVRMEEHLASLEKLNQRIDQAAIAGQGQSAACKSPIWDGSFRDEAELNSNITLRADLHADLIALAFKCDTTRIATLMYSDSGATYLAPEVETGDLHGAIHGYKGLERFTAYRKYFSQRIVYLMDQLAKTPDMDGRTLLDNTLIYITSDMGDGGSHTNANTPVVLAGGAGGALVSGRSIVYGGETRLERMLDTICLAMGADITATDYPGYGGAAGPLTGLLV